MICTDYTDSCKSNYHVITTTTSPIYWTCSQPEYSWNTVRWTSSNNQSINLMIGLLNRPGFILFVIISRTLTRPACHCFALQRLDYFVPTKIYHDYTEAVILFYECISSLKLWAKIPLRRGALDTTLCDKVCQWLTTGLWFSRGTAVSSTNKTDRHDMTEILLKVALNTIKQA
jgi:hypothetical protein